MLLLEVNSQHPMQEELDGGGRRDFEPVAGSVNFLPSLGGDGMVEPAGAGGGGEVFSVRS